VTEGAFQPAAALLLAADPSSDLDLARSAEGDPNSCSATRDGTGSPQPAQDRAQEACVLLGPGSPELPAAHPEEGLAGEVEAALSQRPARRTDSVVLPKPMDGKSRQRRALSVCGSGKGSRKSFGRKKRHKDSVS